MHAAAKADSPVRSMPSRRRRASRAAARLVRSTSRARAYQDRPYRGLDPANGSIEGEE